MTLLSQRKRSLNSSKVEESSSTSEIPLFSEAFDSFFVVAKVFEEAPTTLVVDRVSLLFVLVLVLFSLLPTRVMFVLIVALLNALGSLFLLPSAVPSSSHNRSSAFAGDTKGEGRLATQVDSFINGDLVFVGAGNVKEAEIEEGEGEGEEKDGVWCTRGGAA